MLALLLAVMAQQDIQVSAEVDRDRVEVGNAVSYTVRAIVDVGRPVQVILPSFDGFTVTGRHDSREAFGAAGVSEIYLVELRLRAQRAGLWQVGPVRLEQGTRVAMAPAVEVMVESARTPVPQLGPRVLQLLQRAPPPRSGEVGVSLLVSADTVRIGEQVDIVTAAWFPRETLARMRRPPTIRPPVVDGVYSAVQPSVAGVAASREVGGIWYDIYVAHQVIFPVREGPVTVPPAGLSFGLPAGRQYFSDERSYQLTSASKVLEVRALPPGGPGPVARGLAFQFELRPDPARVGDPIPVDLVLSGSGNLALWPAPIVAWPDGSRGYAEDVVDVATLRGGIVGGTKRFRYLVIADSAGSLALPDVTYRWFDPDRSAWVDATARSVVIPVQPALPSLRKREPLPVLPREPIGIIRLSLAEWLLLLLLIGVPPMAVLGRDFWRRRAGRSIPLATPAGASQLQVAVRSLVPDADDRREERLAASLREAGLDVAMSRDAARAYHQIATGRFDPSRPASPESLDLEAARILEHWPVRLRRQGAWLLAIVALAVVPPSALAQPTPDTLGVRGWYAEGTRAYQAGQDARAAADWIVARRLAPRNPEVRTAWVRVARLSRDLSDAGRVAPLTPAELLLLAGLCWAGGWLAWSRRRSRIALLLFGTAVLGGLGAGVVAWWYARPLAVLTREAAMRQAPHGLAPESGRAAEFAVVEVVATRPGWRLVESPGGVRGWVPGAVLAEVRRLDFTP
jgi:hypothetical protein